MAGTDEHRGRERALLVGAEEASDRDRLRECARRWCTGVERARRCRRSGDQCGRRTTDTFREREADGLEPALVMVRLVAHLHAVAGSTDEELTAGEHVAGSTGCEGLAQSRERGIGRRVVDADEVGERL